MARYTTPTACALVYDALVALDDFVTARQLQERLKLDVNHVSAALYHLRKHKAIDFVEANDALWWFATPQSDTRTRRVDERRPEVRPRRPRRRKLKEGT